jgi:hypothetical protein
MTETAHAAGAIIIANGYPLKEIENLLREEAARLLEASAADIDAWVSRIAANMVVAHADGSDAAIESLKRQIKLLAEVQRVRASDAAWDTFMTVADAIVSTAVRTAVGFITGGALKLQRGTDADS